MQHSCFLLHFPIQGCFYIQIEAVCFMLHAENMCSSKAKTTLFHLVYAQYGMVHVFAKSNILYKYEPAHKMLVLIPHWRATKALSSPYIRAVSLEPSQLAYTKYECR